MEKFSLCQRFGYQPPTTCLYRSTCRSSVSCRRACRSSTSLFICLFVFNVLFTPRLQLAYVLPARFCLAVSSSTFCLFLPMSASLQVTASHFKFQQDTRVFISGSGFGFESGQSGRLGRADHRVQIMIMSF